MINISTRAVTGGMAGSVVLGLALSGSLLSGPAVATPANHAAPVTTQSTHQAAKGNPLTGRPIHRSTVIRRAADWNRRNIQYSQSGTAPAIGGGTYRRDCSGFISMAWRIAPTGVQAPTTWTLYRYGNRISKRSLKSGDMMTWPHHHTVLFHKWANTSHTQMWIYEEANPAQDMNHRVASVSSYGQYTAYRYKKILKG